MLMLIGNVQNNSGVIWNFVLSYNADQSIYTHLGSVYVQIKLPCKKTIPFPFKAVLISFVTYSLQCKNFK